MTDEEKATSRTEDRVVDSTEVRPNETNFVPPEVVAQFTGTPPCVSIEYRDDDPPLQHYIGWNNCGRDLNLQSKWKFCQDGPCIIIVPGDGYSTERGFGCQFNGFPEC